MKGGREIIEKETARTKQDKTVLKIQKMKRRKKWSTDSIHAFDFLTLEFPSVEDLSGKVPTRMK